MGSEPLNHKGIKKKKWGEQTGRDEVRGKGGGGAVGNHDDHPESDDDSIPVT